MEHLRANAIAIVLVAALAGAADVSAQADYSHLCGQAPISTTPVGPSVTKIFRRQNGEEFRGTYWRQPCSASNSMLVLTIEPTVGQPALSRFDFRVLQDGLIVSSLYLVQDPQDPRTFSGDVLSKLSLAVWTFNVPGNFDLDRAITVDFDGLGSGPTGHQLTDIPAYDPGAYGPPVPRPTRDYTGQWHNPAEAGRGLSMFQFGNTLFALWFVYDSEGRAAWYQLDPQWVENDVASGIVAEWTGPAWGPTYPGDRTYETVGDFTLEFTSANEATLTYDVEGVSRSIEIEKL